MLVPLNTVHRSDLLDVSNLVSNENIDIALSSLAETLTESNFPAILDDALSHPLVLELILSNLSSDVPLMQWLLAHFPSDPHLFAGSLIARIMERLSTFFLMQPTREAKTRESSSELAKFVTCAPKVLHALLSMSYLEESGFTTTPSEFPTFRASQRQVKQMRKLSAKNAPHEDVLAQAGMLIPCSKTDADKKVESVYGKLRIIFEQYYLIKIRAPPIPTIIRNSFIRTGPPEPQNVVAPLAPISEAEPKADVNPKAKTETAIHDHVHTSTPTSTSLFNLKSFHYYDTPDGFGQWHILLSSRADREIRSYHRTNPTTYGIVMRKIFDLSNGHFSFDNQKKLSGPSSEIPIYEAKMSGDLRLVYHVDCITSPTDSQREVQALKVFGFYTHAKMDHRLWDSVSRHLHSQGKEYRLRCLKRERRDGDTGDVFVPASFPAREEEEEDNENHSPISSTMLRQNNELHSLITLEKYVALSKDVLDSIESDRDAAFPFELSKYERQIVQHPTSCYVLGRSGTGKTTTMLYKMLWVEKAYRLHTADLQHPRQIFVTRSAVLARKVEEHFLTYTSAFRGVKSRSRTIQDDETSSNDLINHNNTSAWKESKLAFSDLEDSDFPLFIPLDDLYYLLEADIDWDGKHGSALDPSFRPIAELKGRFISFQHFLGEYWPTFSRRLINALNPALVFNEIIGVILGSERTLASTDGHLSKAQYLESSRAASSNFSQEQRASIYDVFTAYKELKRQKDDYDISDRSRTIIAAMNGGALNMKKIDFLYVDETQDNLLIDAWVLRLICRNPNGLFWAGDTAQTISAGSAFRFDDLKAFMYRVELEFRMGDQKAQKVEKQLLKIPPHVFQLATNFRSHAGIVNCAHVVVELIKKFFPHTIDMLKRERGVVEGAKPMFCNDFDADQFKEGGSFSSAMISAEKIELGAHQCILVRDEDARRRFIDEVGDIGLVVTLYDSKGLEFNDVVLLNFFEDSILTTEQWRVVLNEISGIYAPKFDLLKHSAICLELKSLYVAITRARNNLRIIDSSEKSEPMKILWEKLGCITKVSFHEAFSNFAVQSSAEDWNRRAKELFDQEKYALARDSYLRGQNFRHAAVANAFYERERAQRTPNQVGRDKSNQRVENFTKAAEAFVRCAEEAEGASARRRYHHTGGECFEEAHLLMRAVEHYRHAEDFTRAAVLLRKLGSFDEVKDLLIKHESAIDSSVFENLKDVVRLYYVSSRQYSKAHELFDNAEEEIEYLEDRNLDLAQADLLVSLGRIIEAADVHLADGRFEDAISLLINDPAKERSYLIKASSAVLQGLMTYITFGSDPRNSESAERLLSLSRRIPLDVWAVEESNVQEIMMYRFLYSSDIDKLYGLAKTFLACKNSSAALLILDYIYTNTSIVTELDQVDKAAQALAHFSSYIELLRDAAFFGDPCEEKNQRFFGVVQHDADTFSFRPRTVFSAFQATEAEPLLSSQVGGGVKMLNKADIATSFRQCLQDRLKKRVVEENRLCRVAPAFHPCLRHIALKDCKQYPGRCQQPHITTSKSWFLDWLRIHLLQITIYGSVSRLGLPSEIQKEQFFWLKKFFEAVNPPDHTMGSISHLTVAFYEEMRPPLITLRSWIREITASWDAHPPFRLLTMAMLTSDLAFSFDSKEASIYMFRSRFVQQGVFPAFARGLEQHNSLLELLLAIQGVNSNSLKLGAHFIGHVMSHRLKVDIGVFCTFIERVCGQYSAVYKYCRGHESFHGIMLPHSWLRRIITEFDTSDAKNKICQIPFFVLDALESLMRNLHFDTADSNLVMVQSDNFTDIPYHLRSIYISRICRVLGLLAYNINNDAFRMQILQIFRRLAAKGSHVSFPRSYRFYLSAQRHADLVRVVRTSLRDSPFDRMIELRDASRPGRHIRGVYSFKFHTRDDLLTFFAKSGSSASLDDVETVDATAIAVTAPEDHEMVDEDANEEQDEEQDLQEDEEDGKDGGIQTDQTNQEDDVDVKIPEDFYVEHSAEENIKACLIQKAFRRIQEMKKLQSSPGLDGRSYRWFLNCQATLKEEKMQKLRDTAQYRLRYLGALPRLLASIDTIYDQLHTAKNEVKKDLNPRRQLKHELLDGLSERLTNLNASMKTITKFQRNLGLSNPIHQRAVLEELRNNVQQVQDALRNRKFPIVISQEVKGSLEQVYWIVFEKPPKPTEKMPKKPSLNVGDEEEYL